MTSKSTPSSSGAPESAPAEIETASEKPDTARNEAAADPTARLQADLEASKAESEQWRDRFLRKAAEMENFRKRSERERLDASALTKSSVLVEFLPIMDACERALESFKENHYDQAAVQTYREGVELLYKQLGNTLNRLGVTAIEAKGDKFNPNFHEALTHLETQEFEDNTVIEELRRGYLFRDRLLRPAQVVVASRPKPKDQGSHPQ
jgi:molecular chaperone GrpE